MGYTYKSNFEGDVRRFSSDLELTYSRLKDKISNLYSLYDVEFIITYLDDGDNITIADNKDLEEAYKTLLVENEVLRLTVTKKSENNIKPNNNNNNVDSLFIQLLSNQFVQQMIPQVMNSLANNPALMTSIIQTAGSALRKNNSNCDINNSNSINNNSSNSNNDSNINNNENLNNCNNKNINLKRASPHLLNASISNNFHTHSTDSIVATLQPIADQQDNNNNQSNNNSNQNNNQNINNSNNTNNNSRITLTSSNGNESCNGSFSSSISFELVNKENEDNQYSTNSTSSSITSASSASALNNNINTSTSTSTSTTSTTTTTTTNNPSQRPPSPMEKNTNNNNSNRLSGLPKSFLNMLPFTNIKNDKPKDENNNNTTVTPNGSTPPQTISQPIAQPIANNNNNTLSPTQSSPKPEHVLSSSPSKFSPLPPPPISHSPSNVFSHNFNNPYIYSTLPNNNNNILPPPPPSPTQNFNSTIPLPQQPSPQQPSPQQPILIHEQPQQQQSPQQQPPQQQNSDQLNFIKEALQISEEEAKLLLIKHNGDLDKIFGN